MNNENSSKRTRLTKKAIETFEGIRRIDETGVEWWSSRDLARILTYSDYRRFLAVVEKGKQACENSGVLVNDHFGSVAEMVAAEKSSHLRF